MKALLVHPFTPDIAMDQVSPHIGLAYVAAYLKHAGVSVEVMDAQAERLRPRAIRRRVESARPDVVGITATTVQIHHADVIAGIAKRMGVPAVIGGYHAGAIPRETLEEFGNFDFAVYGEGEATMLELVEKIESGGDLSTVHGIAYRKDGKVEVTEPRPQLKDLDTLPFPAFELFPLGRGYRPIYAPRGRGLQLPAASSRGCPYSCTFCYRSMGKKLRERSVGSIIEELTRDIDQFGATQVMFVDDTFTLNRRRTMELCDEMVRQGLHERISWVTETRVDRVDPELLRKMRAANCTHLAMGVESGNQGILNRTEKSITLSKARNAVAWAREEGIEVHTPFILGLVGETKETARDTIEFAIDIDPDMASFSILTPFPGTDIMRMAERGEEGLILLSRDWRKYSKQSGSALASVNLSRRDLERLQTLAYVRFYLRWGKMRNAVQVIRPTDIPKYLLHRLGTFLSRGRGAGRGESPPLRRGPIPPDSGEPGVS